MLVKNIKNQLRTLKNNTSLQLDKSIIKDLLSRGDGQEIEKYIINITKQDINNIHLDLIYYNNLVDFYNYYNKDIENIFKIDIDTKENLVKKYYMHTCKELLKYIN